MTLKVVQGRAALSHQAPVADTAVPSNSQDVSPAKVAPDVRVSSEAVVTTIQATSRTQTGERLSSVDSARDIAKKVASRIRSDRDYGTDTHTGLGRGDAAAPARVRL